MVHDNGDNAKSKAEFIILTLKVLAKEAKTRYNTRLAVIDGINPFMNRSLGDPRIVTHQWTHLQFGFVFSFAD